MRTHSFFPALAIVIAGSASASTEFYAKAFSYDLDTGILLSDEKVDAKPFILKHLNADGVGTVNLSAVNGGKVDITSVGADIFHNSRGSISYSFTIIGLALPTGHYLPGRILGHLESDATGSGNAGANMALTSQNCTYGCKGWGVDSWPEAPPSRGYVNGFESLDIDDQFNFVPNVIYNLNLSGYAYVNRRSMYDETGLDYDVPHAGWSHAMVDPSITFAPEFAGLYRISGGLLDQPLPGVPESSTWALLLSGLIVVGSRLRRQRQEVGG